MLDDCVCPILGRKSRTIWPVNQQKKTRFLQLLLQCTFANKFMVKLFSALFWSFFFFKQKTAYEMLRSLVGSEMCIRDSHYIKQQITNRILFCFIDPIHIKEHFLQTPETICLSYSVSRLGGRDKQVNSARQIRFGRWLQVMLSTCIWAIQL